MKEDCGILDPDTEAAGTIWRPWTQVRISDLLRWEIR